MKQPPWPLDQLGQIRPYLNIIINFRQTKPHCKKMLSTDQRIQITYILLVILGPWSRSSRWGRFPGDHWRWSRSPLPHSAKLRQRSKRVQHRSPATSWPGNISVRLQPDPEGCRSGRTPENLLQKCSCPAWWFQWSPSSVRPRGVWSECQWVGPCRHANCQAQGDWSGLRPQCQGAPKYCCRK